MIIPKKFPTYWSAAHSPVNFEFGFETKDLYSANINSFGKTFFVITTPFSETIAIGSYVYIDSGIYKGYHKVTNVVFSFLIVVDTIYKGAQITGKISYITTHTFKIYKGFEPGELYDFDTVLPFELVAEFTPEPNTAGVLAFNISGYLQSFFNPNNYGDLRTLFAKQYLIGLYNRYRLTEVIPPLAGTGVSLSFTGMVLQSGARQGELNQLYFFLNDVDLAKEIPAMIYANCNTDLSALNSFGAYLKRYDNGVLSTDEVVFSDSFGVAFKH